MPFIQGGHEGRGQQSDRGPLQAPTGAEPRKRRAPRAEQKQAKREVADEVSSLAQQHVPWREPAGIHSEQKMKDRIQDPRRMIRRPDVRRFDADDRQPYGRRQPYLQDPLGRRSQWLIVTTRHFLRLTSGPPGSKLL